MTAPIPDRTQLSTLDAALVACQHACESISRDGFNQHQKFKYSTADNVVEYARRMLTAFGLAWSRTETRVRPCAMAFDVDIGKQAYVGDVVISWELRHESGEKLAGVSEYPVIVGSGRPHEKATQASITYGCGSILLGLLCLDREDENTRVDARDDGGAPEPARRQPPAKPAPANRPEPPRQTGKAPAKQPANGKADASREFRREVLGNLREVSGEDVRGRCQAVADARGSKATDVYLEFAGRAGVPTGESGRFAKSEDLTPSQCTRMLELLKMALDGLALESAAGLPT